MVTLALSAIVAAGAASSAWGIMPPARRIEDRIRQLCARVTSAHDLELVKVLAELRSAIHEYTRRSENRISATVFSWRTIPHERRKA